MLYLAGDTAFNESYATAVERLGMARWQAKSGRAAEPPDVAQRSADFRALTRRSREALAQLYASDVSDDHKRQRKAELMATLRADYAALKTQPAWAGFNGYDAWLARANNATLALQAAYDGWVPGFERVFVQQGQDFSRFHAEARRLASLPAEQRRAILTVKP